MYTTSSVATLPEAPAAYGQPPKPKKEKIEIRYLKHTVHLNFLILDEATCLR